MMQVSDTQIQVIFGMIHSETGHFDLSGPSGRLVDAQFGRIQTDVLVENACSSLVDNRDIALDMRSLSSNELVRRVC